MDSSTIFQLEDEHLARVYHRFKTILVKGRGATVWDIAGKEYVDCSGGYGVALVGHCHPRVVAAVRRQAERLITCHGSFYNDVRARLVEKLREISPRGLDRAFLCNSGAEAVECALKLAVKFTKKFEVVTMTGSYHGKTLGALSVTWNRKYRESFSPLLPRAMFIPFGHADQLSEAISNKTAAVIVEPIQGESGIHVAPPNFLQHARRLCDEYGAILIADEVQCGLGRTGRMWACEHWNVRPDILCVAKGLAGGVPMGATLASSELMSSFTVGEHTTTFGGNPLACAAASASIEAIVEEKLVDRAASVGKFFKDKLLRLSAGHGAIRDVRGIGLMLGVEVKFDVKDLLEAGLQRGVLILYSGRNTLRFLPPLVISKAQVQRVISVLHECLALVEASKPVIARRLDESLAESG